MEPVSPEPFAQGLGTDGLALEEQRQFLAGVPTGRLDACPASCLECTSAELPHPPPQRGRVHSVLPGYLVELFPVALKQLRDDRSLVFV